MWIQSSHGKPIIKKKLTQIVATIGHVGARAGVHHARSDLLRQVRLGAQHKPAAILVKAAIPLALHSLVAVLAAQRCQRVLDVFGAVARRHAVRHTLANAVAVAHALTHLAKVGALVSVGLAAVAVLEAVGPRAFVLGAARLADAHAVAALEALRPLALVHEALLFLDAQAVPLAAHPLALICVARRPHVHAWHLVAELPQSRELPHRLGTRANAVAVRFAILPAATVRAAVLKVEATRVNRRRHDPVVVSVLGRLDEDDDQLKKMMIMEPWRERQREIEN